MKSFQNIEDSRIAILESINLSKIVEAIKPITMQGTNTKSKLVSLQNEGKFTKISLISQVISEASKLGHVDEQIKNFVNESTNAIVSEGIKAKLVFAFECIEANNKTVVSEQALTTLNDLVALDEASIETSIRAGKLNPFRSLDFIGHIIESCNIVDESKIDTNVVSVSHPVSYIQESENGIFFRSGSKVYLISENGIQETSSPSETFTYISSIVESLDFNDGVFSYKNEDLGSFKINENGIEKENVEGVFESVSTADLIGSMKLLFEDAKLKGNTNVRQNEAATDALVALSENFKDIAELDNVYEAVNKTSGDKALFVDNGTNYHILMVESVRQAKLVESFTDVREAIKRFAFKTAADLTTQLKPALEACAEEDEKKTKAIKEHNELIASLNERKATVEGELKDCGDDEDLKEEFNETLKSIEVAIVETKASLNEILFK